MGILYIHSIQGLSIINARLSLIARSLLLIFILMTDCLAEDTHVFLITGTSSKVTSISKHNLRRIYLGGTATNAPDLGNPVLNKSDIETYKLFLKNIMHMTEKGYKRKVIKRVFRQGSDKIKAINDLRLLDEHFSENPNDISFISEKNIQHMINIKTIQKLW